jgi:hypothetical protein
VANQDQHDRAPHAASTDSIGARGAARRRFARAGLGATGVILTLASKPGMAATGCSSASGFESGPSASHSPSSTCEGRSPGFWKNKKGEWLGAYTSPNAKFGDVFTGASPALAGLTLLEVLDPPKEVKKGGVDVDPDNVARHLIASLLNARSQRVTQLPEREVFEIWKQYAATRTYSPRPGVIWNGYDIVVYLKSNMVL